ncbi:MAG: hypothetical protein TR69_WS6001001161 [candidate division WS6 bacterium OLB20]|uniref:Beta-lactamase n=1 Tax=candidate division WS6 bacterium OLB20 TaxID=1617426 RepID=A0A136LX05_9BACT|nr:MAG: hypothetical protein TR69_WS6001001161 [candidate division WS6 bacterium OLB20]
MERLQFRPQKGMRSTLLRIAGIGAVVLLVSACDTRPDTIVMPTLAQLPTLTASPLPSATPELTLTPTNTFTVEPSATHTPEPTVTETASPPPSPTITDTVTPAETHVPVVTATEELPPAESEASVVLPDLCDQESPYVQSLIRFAEQYDNGPHAYRQFTFSIAHFHPQNGLTQCASYGADRSMMMASSVKGLIELYASLSGVTDTEARDKMILNSNNGSTGDVLQSAFDTGWMNAAIPPGRPRNPITAFNAFLHIMGADPSHGIMEWPYGDTSSSAEEDTAVSLLSVNDMVRVYSSAITMRNNPQIRDAITRLSRRTGSFRSPLDRVSEQTGLRYTGKDGLTYPGNGAGNNIVVSDAGFLALPDGSYLIIAFSSKKRG